MYVWCGTSVTRWDKRLSALSLGQNGTSVTTWDKRHTVGQASQHGTSRAACQRFDRPASLSGKPWRPCAASRFRPVSGSTVPPDSGNGSRRPLSIYRKPRPGCAAPPFAPRPGCGQAVRHHRTPRPGCALVAPPWLRRRIPANIGTPPPSEAGNRSTAPPDSPPSPETRRKRPCKPSAVRPVSAPV